MYQQPVAFGAPEGAAGPPPKFVLQLLTRLVPKMRRRLATSQKAFEGKLWREDLKRWDDEVKPAAIRAHLALQGVDVATLDDAALAKHVSACRDHLDRFRVARSGAVLERAAGDEDIAIVANEDGSTREVTVDPARASALCLDDAKLARLHTLATRAEQHFGGDQDLEWAFVGDELFLLQRRAITRRGSERRRPPMSEAKTSRTQLAGLALAAALVPLNSTMVAVALPAMSRDLDVTVAALTQWLVTSYLVVGIVCQSPAGKLGDLWGHRRGLTLGQVVFAMGARDQASRVRRRG